MGTSDYVQSIAMLFKNVTLNALGVQRDLYQLMEDKDVVRAISLMQDNDVDVDNALNEYYPQHHKVMRRPNKPRKGMPDYITCKLPRALQRYINEVELFFLLGNPIQWKKVEGDDEAYKLFMDYLQSSRFDYNMRKVKRIAGAETECAKLYHIYRDGDNHTIIKPVVLARSTGYILRPLFDQYGELIAFAYGYRVKSLGKYIQHWDIHTPQVIFECSNDAVIGWQVNARPNPTGKINVLYYKQPKAWDGVETRIDRIEETDSKIGDTNNYFADPIAFATADVINLMQDPNASGKFIQGTGANSRFEYIQPPQASELRAAEKEDLHTTVLFDTFTPNLSFKELVGMGTLSGEAIKRAMVLAYIKRANRMEIYGEMIDREKNVILAALKIQHPEMASKLGELKIEFSFGEPFGEDTQAAWSSITQLYAGGLVSLETAIDMLSLTDAPQQEIDRIKMAAMEKMMAEQELATERTEQSPEEPQPTDDKQPTDTADHPTPSAERKAAEGTRNNGQPQNTTNNAPQSAAR